MPLKSIHSAFVRTRHQSVWCLAVVCMLVPDMRALGQVSAESDQEKTRILFVFDASNSMNALWGKNRKIETATELLSTTLRELHLGEHLELALRVYGHGTKHVKGQQNCDDTELLVPFSSHNNLIIKQTLGRIRAQGTTPIARSLEFAAEDFPDEPGRNVIVLITDGIEACDEDPCAVSRALQKKGIVVKPFVIGMGVDDFMKESLSCIGNFFDASDPEGFEQVLKIVLEQALHNTTVHLELLDGEGNPLVADVPYSFTDLRTQSHDPQWVHTLILGTQADTLYVDPLPQYTLTLHSLPQEQIDTLQLQPGVHNVITVPDMGQGRITPQFPKGIRTHYGSVDVSWYEPGSCEAFFSSDIGETIRLTAGSYNVKISTIPPTEIDGLAVREGKEDVLEIPAPGLLMLSANTPGSGMILTQQALDPVIQFDQESFSGQYPMQPGNYTLLYRAKHARGTIQSIKKQFEIKSGNTTNVNIHG